MIYWRLLVERLQPLQTCSYYAANSMNLAKKFPQISVSENEVLSNLVRFFFPQMTFLY